MHVLDDLQTIRQRIVAVSRRNTAPTPSTNVTLSTTTIATSSTEHSTGFTTPSTIPTTDPSLETTFSRSSTEPPKTSTSTTNEASTATKETTTTTSSITSAINSTSSSTSPLTNSGNNIIIALSLGPSMSENDLSNLKTYLKQTAAECANDERQVAIQLNNQNRTVFCSNPSCVQSEISQISINQIREFTNDDTVDELQSVLSLLNPDSVEILPSLFLLTDFVSKDLVEKYEDMITFRQKLGSVDFQVILINRIDSINISSSFPKKNLHTLASYTDLLKSKNFFCSIEYHFHLSPIEIAGIAVGVAVTILIIIFIIYKFWDYVKHLQWQNKFLRLEQTSKKENDYLGRKRKSGTILTIQSIICTLDDPWEMSRHQISLGTEVGRGACGTVYRGSLLGRAPCEYIHKGSFFAYQFENNTVAVKVQSTATDDRFRKQLLNEIEIMKALNPHQNIANILGYVSACNPICIVMEYADGGSLKQFMMGRKIELYLTASDVEAKVTCRKDVLSFLWQICDGMSYITESGVIHRDLAARNILLQGKRNVLISDFGLAIWKDDNKKNNMSKRLPIKWTAPEALAHEQFSESSDVWSFGVCAWEILSSGDDPYSHIPNTEVLPHIKADKRLERPVACDDQLWSLLLECWKMDASQRPTFPSIKQSLTAQLDELCQHYGYLDLSKTAS
ncbi:unnamed protein product [Auanema sp. JU1783]|nr:unnamed protein product [Auanema sp. JU1783]